MEIGGVTDSKDPGEEDVGIDPEGGEILHIRIEQHEIRALLDDLPCQHITARDDPPCHPELLHQSRWPIHRIRQTRDRLKFRPAPAKKRWRDKANYRGPSLLQSLGLIIGMLCNSSA